MPEPRVIFVVGHSNWGKSETLRALTSESHRIRRVSIAHVEFFIRRMSNDDLPESFIKRMTSIDPRFWPYIIARLCPEFDDPSKGTATVLQTLCDKGYKLFFWALEKQYGTNSSGRSNSHGCEDSEELKSSRRLSRPRLAPRPSSTLSQASRVPDPLINRAARLSATLDAIGFA